MASSSRGPAPPITYLSPGADIPFIERGESILITHDGRESVSRWSRLAGVAAPPLCKRAIPFDCDE